MDAKRPDEIAEEMDRQQRKDAQALILAVVMCVLVIGVFMYNFIALLFS